MTTDVFACGRTAIGPFRLSIRKNMIRFQISLVIVFNFRLTVHLKNFIDYRHKTLKKVNSFFVNGKIFQTHGMATLKIPYTSMKMYR